MTDGIVTVDFRGPRVLPPVRPVEPSPIDVLEGDDSYEVISELPGVAVEDISIRLTDGVLTIGAKVSVEIHRHVGRCFAVDCRTSLIKQSIALPSDADPRQLTSSLRDGVLSIIIARAPASRIVPLFGKRSRRQASPPAQMEGD